MIAFLETPWFIFAPFGRGARGRALPHANFYFLQCRALGARVRSAGRLSCPNTCRTRAGVQLRAKVHRWSYFMATAQKIMTIRHAEKPEGTVQGVDVNGTSGKEFLVVQGWQRAGALVRFFAPSGAQFQRPGIDQPRFLFASGPVSKKDREAGDGSKSFRPVQTLTPLSQFLGSEVPLSHRLARILRRARKRRLRLRLSRARGWF